VSTAEAGPLLAAWLLGAEPDEPPLLHPAAASAPIAVTATAAARGNGVCFRILT